MQSQPSTFHCYVYSVSANIHRSIFCFFNDITFMLLGCFIFVSKNIFLGILCNFLDEIEIRCYFISIANNALCLCSLINHRSKMVGCAVTLDTSFAQFRNREYRTVNIATRLNSTYIIPSRTNVNKRLTVKYP